jgi:hypothetical protein
MVNGWFAAAWEMQDGLKKHTSSTPGAGIRHITSTDPKATRHPRLQPYSDWIAPSPVQTCGHAATVLQQHLYQL